MSLTLRNARIETRKLLDEFRSFESFPKSYRKEIYNVLVEKLNIDVQRSILISWLPEGGKNLGVRLIDQDGNICFFDIDPDFPEHDEAERYGIELEEKSNEYKQLRPWNDLVLAIEIFREENPDRL